VAQHRGLAGSGGDRWGVVAKGPSFTWRERFRPQAGRIGRAGRGNTALKSSPASCSYLAGRKTAAPTIKVRNENEDQLSHAGSGEIVDQDIPF
jgi:hypothetical protein